MMHPDAAGDRVQGLHNDAGYLLLLHSKDEAWSLYLKEVEKDYVASVHGNHDKYLADATLAFDARLAAVRESRGEPVCCHETDPNAPGRLCGW